MAVDFFHRIVVDGSTMALARLKRDLYHEYPRTVRNRTWTEIVPFSFSKLYDLAPGARRVEAEVPCDPYELSTWPIRHITARRGVLRYQFQTRNMEMIGLIKCISRSRPSLRFALTTMCIDDSDTATYLMSGGAVRKWAVSQKRSESHWERARREFRLTGDDVYDDLDASRWVDGELLADAVCHWGDTSAFARGLNLRRLRWFNRPVFRDLESERMLAVAEFTEYQGR